MMMMETSGTDSASDGKFEEEEESGEDVFVILGSL